MVLDLKQAMSTPSCTPVEILKYPMTPGGLPDAVRGRAYGAEATVTVQLANFPEVYGRCPRRKSHAALKGSASAARSSAAAGSSAGQSLLEAGLSESGVQSMLEGFARKFLTDPNVTVKSEPNVTVKSEESAPP